MIIIGFPRGKLVAVNNLPLDCVIRKGGTLFDCAQLSNDAQKNKPNSRALNKKGLTRPDLTEINAGTDLHACVEIVFSLSIVTGILFIQTIGKCYFRLWYW